MFRRSIARREIAESWQWIRKNYPELYEDAVNWVAEHKDEMKKVDRIYDNKRWFVRKKYSPKAPTMNRTCIWQRVLWKVCTN